MANTHPKNSWITVNDSVSANNQVTLELNTNNSQGLKLILIVFNETEDKRKIREYNITLGSNLKKSCFGVVGNLNNYEVFFEKTLNKLRIKIKNNNLFNLETQIKVMFLG